MKKYYETHTNLKDWCEFGFRAQLIDFFLDSLIDQDKKLHDSKYTSQSQKETLGINQQCFTYLTATIHDDPLSVIHATSGLPDTSILLLEQ